VRLGMTSLFSRCVAGGVAQVREVLRLAPRAVATLDEPVSLPAAAAGRAAPKAGYAGGNQHGDSAEYHPTPHAAIPRAVNEVTAPIMADSDGCRPTL
jgi:hypothetical protein